MINNVIQTKIFYHYIIGSAARLGLEPRYSPSEGDVLPLDDLAALPTMMCLLESDDSRSLSAYH